MSGLSRAFRQGELHMVEQEGFDAGLTFGKEAVNPYCELSWQHEVWQQGYHSGLSLAPQDGLIKQRDRSTATPSHRHDTDLRLIS